MRTATAMRTAGELGFRRERRFPEALAWELVRGLLIDLYRHSPRRPAFLFLFSLFVCPGGGDRENVALSYVYANSGCVAASWLCVL